MVYSFWSSFLDHWWTIFSVVALFGVFVVLPLYLYFKYGDRNMLIATIYLIIYGITLLAVIGAITAGGP